MLENIYKLLFTKEIVANVWRPNIIFPGELDPERMGSGIQYGDSALRQLRSPRRTQPQSTQECGC